MYTNSFTTGESRLHLLICTSKIHGNITNLPSNKILMLENLLIFIQRLSKLTLSLGLPVVFVSFLLVYLSGWIYLLLNILMHFSSYSVEYQPQLGKLREPPGPQKLQDSRTSWALETPDSRTSRCPRTSQAMEQ